jgi:hypothetical protein
VNLQALMALLGHVTQEMTLRYAALANTTVRGAYDAAMGRVRERRQLPLVVDGTAAVPDRIEWLRSELIKTRVAHGYCSRDLAAEPVRTPTSASSATTSPPRRSSDLQACRPAGRRRRAAGGRRSPRLGQRGRPPRRVITSIKRHLNRLGRDGVSSAET